jgi:hypothetical protein
MIIDETNFESELQDKKELLGKLIANFIQDNDEKIENMKNKVKNDLKEIKTIKYEFFDIMKEGK